MILQGTASVRIAAPAEMLWAMVTDVGRMGEWSPETFEARWLGPTGPFVGASFRGCNRLRWVGTWCSMATVIDCVAPRSFRFVIGKDAARPTSEWEYTFEPDGNTTVVTETYRMIREPWSVRLYYRLINRQESLSAGVTETLGRLKHAAERPDDIPAPAPSAPAILKSGGRIPLSSLRQKFFSRAYARLSLRGDARGGLDHRRALVAQLVGNVVEVGCGNGLNFVHYPSTVTEVLAVEPDAYLRNKASRAARSASVKIQVVDADARLLPADDASFDHVVVSLVLCSVDDVAAALAEMLRVLRPGGRLHFYEHVESPSDPLRRAQGIVSPAWRQLAGGCRPDSDTVRAIAEAGFVLETVDRFDHLPGPRFPLRLIAPHVLGVARKPAG